ncbi:MAG: MBL fold metallo-hydrolase [Candidatus Marsarchaeota archaeon]|nr:MBL fold metallo-hydrolase [Candidatus Marsarchaeota archaeon]MCL5102311.1 MBL fold metallo-hydrolase [Candidatus Marsarchaeota archaeon]
MKLSFYGGAHEVGRSAIFLKDKRNLLFDYGTKIDEGAEYPTVVPKADAFILSHAHLDHSGSAPALYNEMSMPTIGTSPTLGLSELLLNDTIKISRKEHTKINFHKRQLEKFSKRFMQVDYKKRIQLGNFDIELFDAGHIAGSALTLVERNGAKDNKRILYTGDFKASPQLLHEGAKPVRCDVMIIESTYATREHPDRKQLVKDFIENVKEVTDNGGIALVPAFAVGRSQELLAVLYKNGLIERTYIDGMAREATEIVLSNRKFIANADMLAKAANECNWVTDVADRREALQGGSVVVTTAGMLSGGPAMHYITRLNNESKVFLTGYQVEGTNGRRLMDTGKIYVEEVDREFRIPVGFYDFSAHSGMSDLYNFVRESAPNKVVCVHGSPENTEAFADGLRGEGFEAYAPKVGDTIDLGE